MDFNTALASMSKAASDERKRFPYLPFREDDSLRFIRGPEHSITLSFLSKYHKHAVDRRYMESLCSDIMGYVLDVEEAIYRTYSSIISINLNYPDNLLFKIHMLNGIECFKFAIENGYPYHYKRVTHINEEEDIFSTYHDLDVIIRLFFINSKEIEDFVVYYFSLFPDFHLDVHAAKYLLESSIDISAFSGNTINGAKLKKMFDFYRRYTKLQIDYEFYHYLNKIEDEGEDHINYDNIIELIQFGIDYGIKADAINIEFMSMFDYVEYRLDFDLTKNLYLYRGLSRYKIRNYNEWYNQERSDIYHSNVIKTKFVITEIVKQNGNTLSYANLAHLIDLICSYY